MNFPKIVKTLDEIVNPVNQSTKIASHISPLEQEIIDKLWRIKGITQAKLTHFLKATPLFMLKEKMVIKRYQNPLKVTHIFLANKKEEMLFGGYVGWIHNQELEAALKQIKEDFSV